MLLDKVANLGSSYIMRMRISISKYSNMTIIALSDTESVHVQF